MRGTIYKLIGFVNRNNETRGTILQRWSKSNIEFNKFKLFFKETNYVLTDLGYKLNFFYIINKPIEARDEKNDLEEIVGIFIPSMVSRLEVLSKIKRTFGKDSRFIDLY